MVVGSWLLHTYWISDINHQEDRSFDAHDHVECELGFQQRWILTKLQSLTSDFSIDTVVKAWQGGSYDGIFAFSQVNPKNWPSSISQIAILVFKGASLGAHLCLLQHLGRLPITFKWPRPSFFALNLLIEWLLRRLCNCVFLRFAILVAGFASRSSSHQTDWQALKVSIKYAPCMISMESKSKNLQAQPCILVIVRLWFLLNPLKWI